MTRRRKIVLVGLPALLVAGAAWAVPTLSLKSRGTATPVSALTWNTATAPTSNDSGTLNDPVGPTPFHESAPTRGNYNLGSVAFATPAFNAGVLTFSVAEAYNGYYASIKASHNDGRTGWVIQGVRLAVPTPEVSVGLDPTACGKALSLPIAGGGKEVPFGIRVNEMTGPVTFDVLVDAVPTGAYSLAACNTWTTLVS